MKTLALVLLLSLSVMAQDRQPGSTRRAVPSVPVLMTIGDDIASGFAQTPWGWPMMLYGGFVPPGSTVGIYGTSLSGVAFVMIENDGRELVKPVVISSAGLLKLEMMVFRLPVGLSGEVRIRVVSRFNQSNMVRFWVQ